jgi:hypothetical protein
MSMKRWFLCLWLLAAPAAAAYHYSAGPAHMQMDSVNAHLNAARQMAQDDIWGPAVQHFQQALDNLPAESVQQQREVRLELATAKMKASQLPESHAELKTLLDEILQDPNRDPAFEVRVRESMASAQFYMTWLMRLEGATREEWEPEIESARQNFRILAEQAATLGSDEAVSKQKENLEASIRLARMEVSDLQGMPLPRQCKGCCSGKCASRKPGKPKDGQKPPKDARGASAGTPADGSGS